MRGLVIDNGLRPEWEVRASPWTFIRAWWGATFTPRRFAERLAAEGSLGKAALYMAGALLFMLAWAYAADAARIYSALRLFDATDTFGRIFTHAAVRLLPLIVWFALACSFCAVWIALLAGQPWRPSLRARWYGTGPITCGTGWWLMYRWLSRPDSNLNHPGRWAFLGLALEWSIVSALPGTWVEAFADYAFFTIYPN